MDGVQVGRVRTSTVEELRRFHNRPEVKHSREAGRLVLSDFEAVQVGLALLHHLVHQRCAPGATVISGLCGSTGNCDQNYCRRCDKTATCTC